MELWDRREAQERPARPDPMTITSVDDSDGRDSVLLLSNADRLVVGLVFLLVFLLGLVVLLLVVVMLVVVMLGRL